MADRVQPHAGDNSDHAGSSASPPSAGDTRAPKASEATHFYSAGAADGDDPLPEMGDAGLGDWEPAPPHHFGKYTIEERIGQGGMGVVWKARDPDLSRTVAIKVLAAHLAQSRTARQRFQREARAAAAISHPHVLTIHAVEEQNQIPFLVMEYVSGGSLKEYVSARGKLTPVQTIQLSCQIAQGLAAAHAQGVIHRDVKPGNVMLHEGGVRVRLADFGLARVAFDNAELTSHDQAVGTPAYMAPEQLRGDRIDARADLFSLGCVMHFMLVGHSPFQGRTQGETIHKILGESPRPLLEIDPTIPPALAEVVDRLLRKDPDERYQSAFEVAAVLERYLTLLNQARTDEIANVLARPGLGARGADAKVGWAGRRKLLVIAAAFAGLTILGIVLVIVVRPPVSGDASPAVGGGNGQSGTVAAPPRVLTVAREGEAEFRTLDDALRTARPGDTVRVIDRGVYEVNVNLHDRRQLVLEAAAGAELISRQPGEHVVQVQGGGDIQIRGFRITTTGVSQHAVLLTKCEGVRLENLLIRQEGAQAVAAIHVADCNVAPAARPLEIRNCRVESLYSGQCLWVHADPQPVWNLLIESNRFQGISDTTLAVVWGRGGRVEIRNNIFESGNVGLNLNLTPPGNGTEGAPPPPSVQVVNNSFHGCKAWIGLVHTDPAATPLVLANNLILDCESVEASDVQQRAVSAHAVLGGNVWERRPPQAGGTEELQRWARFEAAVAVKSRDPAHADFLRLPDDSPLHADGAGGSFSAHVGAQP
jgi:tRNA A-37 threonylcarbamoyl transferase component Bud32